jgi:hypothetical protein
VALFVRHRVQMTDNYFVEFGGLLEAGHAAHPRCSPDVKERATQSQ